MTEPLTPEYLAEIEALAEKATPRPWIQDHFAVSGSRYRVAHTGQSGSPRLNEQHEADAAFIAASREAIPAMAAEIRRLRAELDALNRVHQLVLADPHWMLLHDPPAGESE